MTLSVFTRKSEVNYIGLFRYTKSLDSCMMIKETPSMFHQLVANKTQNHYSAGHHISLRHLIKHVTPYVRGPSDQLWHTYPSNHCCKLGPALTYGNLMFFHTKSQTWYLRDRSIYHSCHTTLVSKRGATRIYFMFRRNVMLQLWDSLWSDTIVTALHYEF